MTGFNRSSKFLILLKHWGYDIFELNWFHGLSKSPAIPFSKVGDAFSIPFILSWPKVIKRAAILDFTVRSELFRRVLKLKALAKRLF